MQVSYADQDMAMLSGELQYDYLSAFACFNNRPRTATGRVAALHLVDVPLPAILIYHGFSFG